VQAFIAGRLDNGARGATAGALTLTDAVQTLARRRGRTRRRSPTRVEATAALRRKVVNALTDDEFKRLNRAAQVNRYATAAMRPPFGAQTASAIDRYLRAGRTHRLADTGPLWVGGGGETLAYYGLNTSLTERAHVAGINGFHLHTPRRRARCARRLRVWTMAVAGWATRDTIDRYTGASATERAAAEARGLGLGNCDTSTEGVPRVDPPHRFPWGRVDDSLNG
jgi:hypothetical protein